MKPHHKENTVYTIILIVVLGIIATFALSASKSLSGLSGPTNDTRGWALLPQVISIPLAKLKISEKELTSCMESQETANIIASDVAEAGATGTPLFYISSATGTYKIMGAIPSAMLTQIIAALRDGKDIAIPAGSEANFSKVTPDTDLAFLELNGDDALLKPQLSNPTVTIVEYGDLSCPACKYAHQQLKPVLAKEDDVQFVYRHHPLVTIHPDAQAQAEVAVCIQKIKGTDAFWSFIDLTYQQ